jgi:hypothetical protein
MGLDFPNPVGLAAGLDKNAEAPLAWWAFGFGFLELGTVTPRPQAGKPKPRMFRDVPRLALINRMGFNNHGADAVAARLAEQRAEGLRPPIPIGLSVGKNATDAERAGGRGLRPGRRPPRPARRLFVDQRQQPEHARPAELAEPAGADGHRAGRAEAGRRQAGAGEGRAGVGRRPAAERAGRLLVGRRDGFIATNTLAKTPASSGRTAG